MRERPHEPYGLAPQSSLKRRTTPPGIVALTLLGTGFSALVTGAWALNARAPEEARHLSERARHLIDATSLEPVDPRVGPHRFRIPRAHLEATLTLVDRFAAASEEADGAGR